MTETMTYAGSGVSYAELDPFKLAAQKAARGTSGGLTRFGCESYEPSRGESCYLIRNGDHYLAHVEEGLGTKNLAADIYDELLGTSSYAAIAQCTAAMIVNDMITVGALPVSLAMHLAVGDSVWFKNDRRVRELIRGWAHACKLAGCSWGGGETPTLKGIVVPGTVVLSGSAIGRTRSLKVIDSSRIKHGDAIVLFGSSGIHANGLTLAREIAKKLPDGYETLLCDGRTYGQSLLAPTLSYVQAIESCMNRGIDIHYAVNITGHGWRKLMRAPGELTYVIERLPRRLPVFQAIQEYGPVDDNEAFGNLNMGAGFGIYISRSHVSTVRELAIEESWPFDVIDAGHIETGARSVVIHPKGLTYAADSLQVR